MYFGVAAIISLLLAVVHASSRATSSRPGTPGGVGVFRDPPVLLGDGDEVVVEIERIGRLRQHVPLRAGAAAERMSSEAERFLVTGALGCIGAWTVARLVREGAPVAAFDLGGDPRRLRLIMTADELAARRPSWPATSPTWRRSSAVIDRHGITNVIHLAALQVPFCRADPPLGALVNVVGTVNVFEAVKRRAAAMAPRRLHELDGESTPPTTPIR